VICVRGSESACTLNRASGKLRPQLVFNINSIGGEGHGSGEASSINIVARGGHVRGGAGQRAAAGGCNVSYSGSPAVVAGRLGGCAFELWDRTEPGRARGARTDKGPGIRQ